MAKSITIVFSAKDLDLSAILFMYKGEQIHIPFNSAGESCSSVNQILSSNEDEIPELVRIRTSFTNGATPGIHTPTQKITAPIVRAPIFARDGIATPGSSPPPQLREAPSFQTRPIKWHYHRTTPSISTTDEEYATPVSQLSPIDRKAPNKAPSVLIDPATSTAAQNDDHSTTAPASFKISVAAWKDELASSSLAKTTFDNRSFRKCAVNGTTDKARRVLLTKITTQIGEQDFWECIPFECHDSPRPIPANCGKPFLEQVLRSVMRTKRETSGK